MRKTKLAILLSTGLVMGCNNNLQKPFDLETNAKEYCMQEGCKPEEMKQHVETTYDYASNKKSEYTFSDTTATSVEEHLMNFHKSLHKKEELLNK